MSLLNQKLSKYKTLKEGSKESQDLYKEMCNLYNQSGYKPSISSLCYCNRSTNIKW